MRKNCSSSPEKFKTCNTIHHPCYLHRVEEHLPSIWLGCVVGPSPVYTLLSVGIVSMHATFMTFIIHRYLHHLCTLSFFNNHLFRIYLSQKKREKKKKKEKEKRNGYGRVISPVGCHP